MTVIGSRVAKSRNMSEERIRELVTQNTKGRIAAVLCEPRVNVCCSSTWLLIRLASR